MSESKKPGSANFGRVPYSRPPFTLGEIKKAIPPHCFQRFVLHSFYYVIHDLNIAFIFYYIATNYIHLLPYPLSFMAWPVYWIFQGCVLSGVWVIGHECGHHAFSDYQWLDDTVGFILHTALLVPYFSWKYSHRRHHSNMGSLKGDDAHVAKHKLELTWYAKYLNNPPARAFTLVAMLVLGMPLHQLYIVSNRHYDRFASHYDPYVPIYSGSQRLQIYLSDVGVLAVTYGLYRLASAKGLAWVLCVYRVPLLIVNGFFVLLTYLHHTHPSLPRYDSSEWDWLRGSLATVDRDYGILNKVFHHITDTHVTHHLFSTMPHYHATEAIKPILGDYYLFDGTPFFKAFWREAKECIYVEADEGNQSKGVFWYNNNL